MEKQDFARLFAMNLQHYMNINQKTQKDLARDLGISKATVSTWCNGVRVPRPDAIDTLCGYFNIRRSDLLSEGILHDEPTIPTGRRIPVLARVAAGIPMDIVENITDYEQISSDLKGDYFALSVRGDSMNPRIYDGDVVIVKRQDDAENGEVVIASVNGGDAVCKKLVKYPNHRTALVSLNAAYDPMLFDKPIQIWGVVVEIRGKMRGM